jgi:putative SOS response-associated peptidase YedK
MIAFAGLWDPWLGADGSEVDGAAMVTVAAGADLAGIADRMPAIVARGDYVRWLGTDPYPSAAAAMLLKPAEADTLVAVPVGERVNRVENDDPGLVEPTASGPA